MKSKLDEYIDVLFAIALTATTVAMIGIVSSIVINAYRLWVMP
jgi:hypothetical protein